MYSRRERRRMYASTHGTPSTTEQPYSVSTAAVEAGGSSQPHSQAQYQSPGPPYRTPSTSFPVYTQAERHLTPPPAAKLAPLKSATSSMTHAVGSSSEPTAVPPTVVPVKLAPSPCHSLAHGSQEIPAGKPRPSPSVLSGRLPYTSTRPYSANCSSFLTTTTSSSIPYIPALPPPATAAPLPEPPAAAARQALCDRIHNTTWAVGRLFGFQAFNSQEPQAAWAPPGSAAQVPQWIAATAFLAADHLEALLVRNMMPRMVAEEDEAAAEEARGGKPGNQAHDGTGEEDESQWQPQPHSPLQRSQEQQERAFALAVWELHSHIFLSYEGAGGWCRLVGVSPRPAAVEVEVLSNHGAAAPEVLHLLLCELALYFLIYSEAANLRHTPELMWFLFWAANHSPGMEGLWREGGLRLEQQVEDARRRRLAMRNNLQAQIKDVQKQMGHIPAACRPEVCSEVAAALAAQLPALLPALNLPVAPPPSRPSGTSFGPTDASDSRLVCAASRELFTDMACFGDGGFWTDTIVAPLFTVLAFEIDYMASTGQEVAHRLGYDDVNESMCRKDVVRRLLESLGVSSAAAKEGQVHGALEALTRLGQEQPADEGGDGDAAATSAAAAPSDPRQFDPVQAAAFWADHVFVKTHRERRSWLALLRAFYRVFSLQLVLLHAIMAHAFAPGSLTALSSAVLTHAVVAAMERTTNWWLTRGTRDPLQAAKARESWVTAPPPLTTMTTQSDAETGAPQGPTGPLSSRLSDGGAVEARLERRRRVAVEGSPLWGVFGWLEWVLAAVGMVGLFVLQYMGPASLQPMARSYWPLAAGGYVAAVVGHGLLTTRDGYCLSLSSTLRLPALFRASSQRAAADCWLARPLAVGWRAAALTALFWVQVLAAKAAFDYFVIMRPMAGQVRLILHRNWLGCASHSPRYRVFGTELPLRCVDGDFVLVVLRVAPFVLVCLVDTQIFYQLVLMLWGVVQGLVGLNLGVAGSWEGLRAEFHRAPLRWWARCMSTTANKAARAAAAAAQRRRREAAAAGGCAASRFCSEDEDSDYGSVFGAGKLARINSFSSHSSRNSGLISAGGRPSRNSHGPSDQAGSPHAASVGDGSTDADSASVSFDVDGGERAKGKVKGKGKGRSGARRDAAAAAELVAMLAGQGDEQLAQWMAFAAAWDAVVEDLRASDLISDRERSNLVFTRLPAAATSMAAPLPAAAGSAPSSPDSASAESAGGAFGAPGSPAAPKSLRPILLPAFFYAGQVQRVVDTGSASPSQQLVLGELRALLVWLGCQLRMLDGTQAAALLAAPCCPSTLDVAHSRSREKGLAALRKLVAAMSALQGPPPPGAASGHALLQRRRALYGDVATALDGVLTAVEVEARAMIKAQLGSKKGKKGANRSASPTAVQQQQEGQEGQQGPEQQRGSAAADAADPQAAAVAVMEVVAALRSSLVRQPDRLAEALALLHPENGGMPPASATAAASSPSASAPSTPVAAAVDLSLLTRVLSNASKMLNLSSSAAQPTAAEARRILGFFVTSLANRQLAKPSPVATMTSWTVLTPAYGEDVLFPLEARAAADALGLAPPSGVEWDPSAALPDLLTETEERVSLMAYIRSMYPKDWDNFKERLGAALGAVDLRAATETDFTEGGPLSEHALALQLWASYRGQLLARTVRGMAAYERALRVLAALECPRLAGVSRREHAAVVEDLVGAKFTHVVASQLYGNNRRSSNLRDRWLAESTDVLLEAFPSLRVSYLDLVPVDPATVAAAVTVAGASAPPPAHQYAVLIRGRRLGAAAAVSGGRTEELYRVRLPYNRYSKRGVILGEGKPENQNHAIIFCFGEAVQTIDMNQDNALAEALKMRNLLAELQPERDTKAAKNATQALRAALHLPAAGPVAGPAAAVVNDASARAAPGDAGAAASALPLAADLKRLLSDVRSTERPVAVVGFREWVFSDKAGALGSFAASSEFAFGTMMQRTMTYPANVRLHYGHPDAFNKLFVMTRGGLAKATRQLHVSEDIFGGMNHSLRGARIKFREYISVGKGRDMGFDSINAFESKISAGFGEVVLSRDLLRLAARLDLWRCLHLYHSLAGNYFNTWLVMGSVYAHVYALLFFALTRAAVYRTIIYYPSPPPPPPGTPMVPMSANAPSPPPGVIRKVLAYDTIRVEHVLQLGLLSLLPYVAEVALEHGLVRGTLAALAQVVSGSFSFFIFKQQTTTTTLHRSMLYGGSTYVATGRGFSITSSSFIKLFSNYGRSHIALGFELAAMAIAMVATNDCARCSYAGLTWGTWLAALSLVLAPCWFNPMAFSPSKVKRDMHAWAAWLRGEADRELGFTWHQWNRRQLEHSRNDSGAQTDRGLNVAQSLLLRAAPPALLALAAASRLTLRFDKLAVLPSVLRTSWALFLLATVLLWGTLAAGLSASRRFNKLSDRRRWRLWSFWVGAGGAAAVVLFLVGLARWYSGNGLSNLCLILYANANLLLALHRTLEYTAPRSHAVRRLVDGGYWLLDCVLGWALLGLLGALSLAGVVGRIQTTMLFNVTFARSVRRGSLVKTIGTAKAERRQQEALVGMVLEGDTGSVGSDGGSGGGAGGGRGGRKSRGTERLQLQP